MILGVAAPFSLCEHFRTASPMSARGHVEVLRIRDQSIKAKRMIFGLLEEAFAAQCRAVCPETV